MDLKIILTRLFHHSIVKKAKNIVSQPSDWGYNSPWSIHIKPPFKHAINTCFKQIIKNGLNWLIIIMIKAVMLEF